MLSGQKEIESWAYLGAFADTSSSSLTKGPMPVGAVLVIRRHFCFSKAAWYSSCIDAPHHSVILSIHSLCGRPLLLLPSNLPNTTDLIFLSFSILHLCPKSSSFLVIIFCIRFSVRSLLLYNSAFVTFCIQPILRIILYPLEG